MPNILKLAFTRGMSKDSSALPSSTHEQEKLLSTSAKHGQRYLKGCVEHMLPIQHGEIQEHYKPVCMRSMLKDLSELPTHDCLELQTDIGFEALAILTEEWQRRMKEVEVSRQSRSNEVVGLTEDSDGNGSPRTSGDV
ncbi:hypothetical protein BGW42_002216 [Actinomortierella wolfii]|nr:hypothetical protein BGW42_002216 [Actinomortierella wolfii]